MLITQGVFFMNMQEYEKIQNLNYLEYCDYLVDKYGIGRADYMDKNYVYNIKSSRTLEGLIAHHKYEDHAVMLSVKRFAERKPFEWQLAENLIYCDYLEHLFLHILICENPPKDLHFLIAGSVGIGGILNYIVPQLNDLFSGWIPEAKKNLWMQRCFDRVKEEKDVYFVLLKRFKTTCKKNAYYTKNCLCQGFNGEGNWPRTKDKEIFNEIKQL